MTWSLDVAGLDKKEATLFSGDFTSAFLVRVLLLLDALLTSINFFFEKIFLGTDFFEDARLLIFFLRLSS